MWTRFMDMNSGGGKKEDWEYIYIEAPEEEAKVIFYNRFGHNPERVTCTCCGDDYSISSEETLEGITDYERGARYEDGNDKPDKDSYRSYMTIGDYLKKEDVLVVRESEIEKDQRQGEVPEEGYVWM